MKQSAITARKRELRERIAELMSKRGKIGKKNFGKSLERKKLTEEIKKVDARASERVRRTRGARMRRRERIWCARMRTRR